MTGKYLKLIAVFSIAMLFQVLLPMPAQASDVFIDFSGYRWNVKDGFMGPGGNFWNPDRSAVFVDAMGQLHLKVTQRNGQWYSSEVYLPTSLGFGTYEFEIASDVRNIDQNLVAAPFLYQDDTHEFDIEFTNWKRSVQTNSQYVVQPYPPVSNLRRFSLLNGDPSVNKIIWTNESVRFVSMQNGAMVNDWNYVGSNNFWPGDERVHINFWMIDHTPPSDFQEKEFIVKSFRFIPQNAGNTPPPNGIQTINNIQPFQPSLTPQQAPLNFGFPFQNANFDVRTKPIDPRQYRKQSRYSRRNHLPDQYNKALGKFRSY